MARTIGLIVKSTAEAHAASGRLVAEARKRGFDVCIEARPGPPAVDARQLDIVGLTAASDIMVAVGGDGTFLRAARAAGPASRPLAGVNLGHLGFLTEFEMTDIPVLLDTLAKAEPAGRHRTMIRAAVEGNGASRQCGVALNDAVVGQGSMGRMIRLRATVDGHLVAEFLADGLIVATATGSTAYSFSAGGPIVHAEQDVLILTPICSHTLAIRPLVIPASSTVAVEVIQFANEVFLTMDGQERVAVSEGERMILQAAEKPLYVLQNPARNFYSTLRRKLGWGTSLRDERVVEDGGQP